MGSRQWSGPMLFKSSSFILAENKVSLQAEISSRNSDTLDESPLACARPEGSLP